MIATPSGCYANPALAPSALVAHGRFGLSGLTGATCIGADITGALIAFGLVSLVYFDRRD